MRYYVRARVNQIPGPYKPFVLYPQEFKLEFSQIILLNEDSHETVMDQVRYNVKKRRQYMGYKGLKGRRFMW